MARLPAPSSNVQGPSRMLTLTSFTLGLLSLQVSSSAADHRLHHAKRHSALAKRQPAALPDGWVSEGCYSDSPDRTFTGPTSSNNTMTQESCVSFCAAGGYLYAGIEYANQCYCDNGVRGTGAQVSDGCTMPCAGNANEMCGGPWRLNVFRNSNAVVPPPPAALATYGNWKSVGCYTDSTAARSLAVPMGISAPFTTQKCLDQCASQNYAYAGTEYGTECYCGQQISNGGAPAGEGCNMVCAGNSSQLCGGPSRLNLYQNTPGGGSNPPPSSPTTTNVAGWKTVGCYTDSETKRSLDDSGHGDVAMTPGMCTAFCAAGKFQYAGIENGVECYCGNTLGGEVADGKCTMACGGNPNVICGGPDELIVYQVANPLPTGWSDVGCYVDGPQRTLKGPTTAADDMTPAKCAAFCGGQGYNVAGTEYSHECYCDSTLTGQQATDGCTMPCAGDAAQMCGGPFRLNVIQNAGGGTGPPNPGGDGDPTDPNGPTTLMTYGNWTSSGCTSDNVGGRSLPIEMAVDGAMTVQKCLDGCFKAGYKYAGVEYSAECYCATQPAAGAKPANSGCNMPCAGDPMHLCGGPDRLNMYQYNGNDLPTPGDPGNGGDPGGGPGGGQPGGGGVGTGLPPGWTYNACWVDGQFGRILNFQQPDDPDLTAESCIAACSAANYTLAGLEYSAQCFCGNYIQYAGSVAANQADCNMPCGGNPDQMCGAGNRISLYSAVQNFTIYPAPTTKTTNLPGNWAYKGCYAEPAYPAPRTFIQQLELPTTMSAQLCLDTCFKYGYLASAFEFGQECYCGDPAEVTAAATPAPEADCSFACSGDPGTICGGALRMSVYYWVGGGSTVWHTPQNTGYYQFLIGAPVVALQTTLGVNNKVTFLEKIASGAANSTHAYELDYSLADQPLRAWREMHVKTDIFCGAGIVLPDKVGRQLNIGGWSLDSTFGVRLYTPNGQPGTNGTNDWEEDVNVLRLQRGRWYPSAMLMSNGSVLVIGGQIGANDLPEPSLEVLPRPPGGPTFLNMDWLLRTDPYNLYPFLFVLPSGGIYVQYYNEARILDPVTFATRKELPNTPGSISKPGGRTYPLEGTGVLFPIHAPYTDPVTLMSCGGSDEFYGLDNCVSIQPEVDGAQWAIERMPFRRVMSCVTALPDGTFLIVNGAQQGQAGFGLAIDPTLTALLYDPSLPLHERISILNTTIVARMYHSEAILLHDGRVLISGSDPLDTRFPEDYRVEVYVPPYLSSGLARPAFTIANKDWAYNGQYQITLTASTSNNIRVSLVGAEANSHGSNFGQRTIFPAVTCQGNTCTITAPPNNTVCPAGWFQLFVLDGPTPSMSVWVRIGGDPGKLGNWPQYPGFTVPGV